MECSPPRKRSAATDRDLLLSTRGDSKRRNQIVLCAAFDERTVSGVENALLAEFDDADVLRARAAILDLSDACVQRGGGELSLADVLAAAPAGSDELATATADELRLTSQLYTILVRYFVIKGTSRSNAAQNSAPPPKRKMLATEQLCQITA